MGEYALRIKMLIQESGKTYQELETLTGIAKSSLQRYASGVTAKIPTDVIEKLETALDAPRGYIMGWQEERALPADVPSDPCTQEMIEQYLKLSENDRFAVRMMVTSMLHKTTLQDSEEKPFKE